MKVHSPRLARFAASAVLVALAGLGSAAAPALADHQGTPTSVSLVAEHAAVTIPDSIKVTAEVDHHLYGTGYTVAVIDDESGAQIGGVCIQTPCPRYGTTSWADNPNPQPRHFHAELRDPGGGTVASSGQVTVEVLKHTWEVLSVVPNVQSRVVPGDIQFLATLDHSVDGNGGGYLLYVYDEDSPTWPATCAYSGQCAKTISRTWADNASPKQARVRVEVRNAAGDVASNIVYADAQFRRFIFTVSLAFSTRTEANGNVVHTATATTDRSVHETGYTVKIKTADGIEVCAASNGTQCGPRDVAVGQTYRAIVENSSGHVAGASGTWLLTDSGPEPAMLGSVDLAYVASRFATVSGLCEELLVRGGFSGGDTLPDWYQACEAALAAGKTVVQALVAVAAVEGGAAIIHMVAGDQIAPTPESGEATPDDSVVYRPLPLPIWIEIQDLADRLQQANLKLQAQDADEVATQCKLFMGRRGRPADDCLLHPIIAPGSDMPTITKHTLTALGNNFEWALLHYDGTKPPAEHRWYVGTPPCVGYDTAVQECDEFPYFPTLEGGPIPVGSAEPSLWLVPYLEHRTQGGHMGNFYNGCTLKTRPDNPPFWVIPMYWEGPRTLKLCNGWGPPVVP